ncbi:MAG: transposase domain-containing protein, partial [Gordonibacter sp.]|uniref:transposase domain-containing protein n=1 Tax=Gordonibacter sp. TaxID=1968902 RepID=UPI002FC923FC
LYSIVTTAKGNGLKTYEYLEWLLTEMPARADLCNKAVLSRFLPWSEAIPDSCKMDAAEKAASDQMVDRPIIDINPEMLDSHVTVS